MGPCDIRGDVSFPSEPRPRSCVTGPQSRSDEFHRPITVGAVYRPEARWDRFERQPTYCGSLSRVTGSQYFVAEPVVFAGMGEQWYPNDADLPR
jgi:hypothetical protein